jgi:hypothetical protein
MIEVGPPVCLLSELGLRNERRRLNQLADTFIPVEWLFERLDEVERELRQREPA